MAGPPLVCLHGVGGSPAVWEPVRGALEERHRVLVPTLRGHSGGEPFPPGVAPTIPALADALEAELDAAGIDRAHLVGNSLGGWLAFELAARGRALSVVALSPAGGWLPGSREVRRVRGLILPAHLMARGLGSGIRLLVGPAAARRAMLGMAVGRGDHMTADEAERFFRDNAECSALRALLDDAVTRDFTVPEPDVPVRIAWGEQDRLLPPPRYSDRFTTLFPRAERRTLPGAGHVPTYDDPAVVTRTILEVTTSPAA